MAKTPTALDFKSASLDVLRAVLHTDSTEALLAALAERMQAAGGFYDDEALVLDARTLLQAPDWTRLVRALREHRLHPIGVAARNAEVLASVRAAGLTPLALPDPRQAADAGPAPAAATAGAPAASGNKAPAAAISSTAGSAVPATDAPDAPATGETLLIEHPLRSGQRVYARHSDLIVLGMVSQGAEVIADGHIHVYGPLRGKAMAGARGNARAMIFTTQLEPELLAIAGVYRVVETQLPASVYQRPARVVLQDNTLHIHALREHKP